MKFFAFLRPEAAVTGLSGIRANTKSRRWLPGNLLSLSTFVALYRLWIECSLGAKMRVSGYKIEIEKLSEADGGGYLVSVPELPGCSSAGETEADAVAGIGEAIEGWIVTSLRLGHEIPHAARAKRASTADATPASYKVHAA